MRRNPNDVVLRWRRRLTLAAGTCGLLLLSLAFAALPVAADGHGGNSGGHHDGQGVEVEHYGNDGPNHDINDDRGDDANHEVNDDRGDDANDNDVNDDRGNEGMLVLMPPKVVVSNSGR